ncbi:HNH endonuclease [Stenotrophomonas maltophilia]|uniref:HNH endonuclease n=1 Tax=Stenotrophomonas maltophilia TaxID=40324 RepID=UPI0012AFEB96|nr:SAVED domain-containing protein [Stenotrophomonas maltophilia]QGL66859.1 HNH endonuclease [Stenotrophomonas maltophilia]
MAHKNNAAKLPNGKKVTTSSSGGRADKKAAIKKNREDASPKVKDAVWIRAAGHCELCGRDLSYERLSLSIAKLGEVAHILPASPDGPRGSNGGTVTSLADLSDRNDPGNLMLLCDSCHREIDKTPSFYPAEDLTAQHEAFIESIRFAATRAKANQGQGVLIQGNHFETLARIDPTEIQTALWRDRTRPVGRPLIIDLPRLDGGVRDDAYYVAVRKKLKYSIDRDIPSTQSDDGDGLVLGIAGIADMPSMMLAGQAIGDRRRRKLYSSDRKTGLVWPDISAKPKDFKFEFEKIDAGPVAFLLEISVVLSTDAIHAATTVGSIARFTASDPSYSYIRNGEFIDHFREQIQPALGIIEAHTAEPIHLFMAIPAALAFELGALLSTNHRHKYIVYDIDDQSKTYRQHTTIE